jgi:hypothetical protein
LIQHLLIREEFVVRKLVFALCSVALLAAYPRLTSAQNSITSITVNNVTAPGQPVCLGDTTNFTAKIQGSDYLGTMTWFGTWGCTPIAAEQQFFNADGSPMGGVMTGSRQENVVGSLTIRASATFSNGQGGAPYVVNQTVTYTILPPDTITLANPAAALDTPFDTIAPGQNPNITIAFNVQRGARVLSGGGVACEAILRSKYIPGAENRAWGPAPFLTTGPGSILDQKAVVGDAGFAAKAPGVVDEFDQVLGLRVASGCGGTLDFRLSPNFHFQMIKVDDGHWKLVQMPLQMP